MATVLPATELRIATERFHGMTTKQLSDFRSVMRMLDDQLSAFQCQPRFGSSDNQGLLNEAGELLEEVQGLCQRLEVAAVYAATRKDCRSDPVGAEWRGWCILGHHADNRDDLADFAAHAAEAARDEAHARIVSR